MRGKSLFLFLVIIGLSFGAGRLSIAVVDAFGTVDPPGLPAGTSFSALSAFGPPKAETMAGSPISSRSNNLVDRLSAGTEATQRVSNTPGGGQSTDVKAYLPVILKNAGSCAKAGDLYATDSIVGNLRYVPAGTFMQGSPTGEPGRSAGEAQFQHTLTKNMAVMETEVSQAMWTALKAAQSSLPGNPSNFTSNSGNPVEQVTWYEAVLFANLLSLQQGLTRTYYTDGTFTVPVTSGNYTSGPFYCNWNATGYRLPSEGEWEYFARAGQLSAFSVYEPLYASGTVDSCTSGALPSLEGSDWFCANSGSSAHPVGGKNANPWGLKDVHGNVWEWCWDWYSAYPNAPYTDWRGLGAGSTRVVRGGSWNGVPRYVRSAARNGNAPGGRYNDIGFRLLRSVN